MSKKTKKYNLSRSDIVDRLQDLIDRLYDVDTTNTAPSDVESEIMTIKDDLEELQGEVTDEAL